MPEFASRWRIPAVVAAGIAVIVVLAHVSLSTSLTWRPYVDVEVYWQGARQFWTSDDLYARLYPTAEVDLPFTYPPVGAVVFTPLWWLVELVGLTITERIFTVVSVIALYGVALLLMRIAGIRDRSWTFVAFGALMVTVPVISTLGIGQINIMLMALTLIDVCRSPNRWLPLGVLTGLCAAIKLTPLVFGVYFLILWIVRRSPRGLLGMVVGFLGSTALAALLRPQTTITYFTEVLASTERIGEPWYAKNVSLRATLERLPILEGTADALWLIGVATTVLLISWATYRVLSSEEITTRHSLLAVSLVSLIALICSPVSWYHHWVWLGPLVAALWLFGFRLLAIWGALAQTLGSFHMFVPSGNMAELSWSPLLHILATHYLWYSTTVITIITVLARPVRSSNLTD